MNNRQTKTNNSYLAEKINLRLRHLPNKKSIEVLDCFAGKSVIWNRIKSKSNYNINVIGIDKIKYGNNLNGDNVKYLKGMDLKRFDLIDLDAYGIPFKQLEIIFNKGYRGILFITFIQSMFGALPAKMLNKLGYTKTMIKRCPTLFNKNGIDKFKKYLATKGIKKIIIISKKNKNYICIMPKTVEA